MKALFKLIMDKISFFFCMPEVDRAFDAKGNLVKEEVITEDFGFHNNGEGRGTLVETLPKVKEPVKKKSSKKKVSSKKKASKKKVSKKKKAKKVMK